MKKSLFSSRLQTCGTLPTARTKTAILVAGVLAAATLAGQAATILSTGFEPPSYTGGPAYNSGNQLTSQGWVNALGALPNFDVYTYAGNQVPYTPAGAVPVIGGIPQLVTVPQNPNGGLHFTANGNQSGDQINFAPLSSGLVEMSIDYYAGDWYDNNGGNFNGGFTLRPPTGSTNQGGFFFGRSPSQLPGDVNGNGLFAPQFLVWRADDTNTGLTSHGPGFIFTNVAGFDNLARGIWHRMGIVFDKDTGELTQLKSQELIAGGNIYTMNNPVGPSGEGLYIQGGLNTTRINSGVRLYNVGNGTLSGYDNLYLGDPYTWTPIPEPSTMGLVLAGLAGLALVRRRK